MARIDVYLRSIEKFGAGGAVLTSGQNVVLRFPDGDRNASQTIPHDALVVLIREIAPPAALDAIDKNRAAKFEMDSAGTRYNITVAPKAGSWQVEIEGAVAAAGRAQQAARAATPSPVAETDEDLLLERGQYDLGPSTTPAITTGSIALDTLLAAARASRATDLYLTAACAPFMRVAGQLTGVPSDRATLDGDQLSRELGIAAPAEARAAWADRGTAVFAYSDAGGRVRVTLTRDHRGPGAALRLLVAEPPALDRLELGDDVDAWLDRRGLLVVAGASGAGKTTTLAAIVRALGERSRRVVSIEDPIEIMQSSSAPWISQRALGDHVASYSAGVAAAMREGADVIVVGEIATADAAAAVVDAVAGGHLVLATLVAAAGSHAIDRLVARLAVEHRDQARAILADGLLGTIGAAIGSDGRGVAFEVYPGSHAGRLGG